MFQVGLHITKNDDKHLKLVNHLQGQLNHPRLFDFIKLSSEEDIEKNISQLNILHCYEIKKHFFNVIAIRIHPHS